MSATGSLTTALEVTNAAEKLAVAGRGELNDTTLLLASTLNAYGAGVDQAGKFSDAFFTAIQSGQTTLPELAASLGQVAPIAAAVGLPIGDLTATIATLTKNGLDTSQDTTGLKAALSNLIQPSTEAADEAKRLGIQFDVNAVATKGWSGFLADLTQKTGGSSSELSKFFGSVEGLNAVLSLTRDGTHGLADAIALTGGNAGVTESAYKVMVNTIQVATQQMENAIRAAATVIGDNLRQPFIDSEHAVEHLFDAIRNAAQSGAFDSLIKIAQDVLKVFADTVEEVAKNLPAALKEVDLSGFAESLRDLAHEIGTVFGEIDLSTPAGLAKAIQGVVDTGETLVRITKGIVEAVEPVIARFVTWASSTNDLSKDTKELIGNVLGIATEINKFLPGVNSAVQSLTSLAEIMGAGKLLSIIGNLTQNIPLLSKGLGDVGSGTTLGLAAAAYAAGVALGTLADKLFGITPALTPLTEKLQQFVSGTGPEFIKQQQFIALALHGFATEVGGATDKSAKLEEQAKQNRERFAEWAKVADELGSGLGLTADGLVVLTTKMIKAGDASQHVADFIRHNLVTSLEELGIRSQAAGELIDAGMRRVVDASGHLTDTIAGTADAFTLYSHAASKAEDDTDKLNQGLSKTVEQMLAAEKQANEIDLAWAKLEQEDRNLLFKLEADIAIAQIQQGTELVKAAFESINEGIKSTGDSLTELAKLFAEVSSGTTKSHELLDLLDDENKRRQQEFDLQKELTKTQIDYLNAVTDRLNSGDATISVDMTGVEPILQELMFSLLKQVQLKASAESQLLLLGLQ